eukprot:3418470-Pyramimonas_sp.AAC.1
MPDLLTAIGHRNMRQEPPMLPPLDALDDREFHVVWRRVQQADGVAEVRDEGVGAALHMSQLIRRRVSHVQESSPLALCHV